MAGYWGTPLPGKLGIREHSRVRLLAAPEGFAHSLGVVPRARGEADVIVAFFTSRARLAKEFGGLRAALDPAGGVWIAWPKRASGVATDLDENIVREIGLGERLVDNKVCAIDDVWSGLRFVVRVKDR
jgi:hypothetical protein